MSQEIPATDPVLQAELKERERLFREMTARHPTTVQKMARILGVHVNWLYQRTRMGPSAIPFIRVGRYVCIEPKEMDFLMPEERRDTGEKLDRQVIGSLIPANVALMEHAQEGQNVENSQKEALTVTLRMQKDNNE